MKGVASRLVDGSADSAIRGFRSLCLRAMVNDIKCFRQRRASGKATPRSAAA